MTSVVWSLELGSTLVVLILSPSFEMTQKKPNPPRMSPMQTSQSSKVIGSTMRAVTWNTIQHYVFSKLISFHSGNLPMLRCPKHKSRQLELVYENVTRHKSQMEQRTLQWGRKLQGISSFQSQHHLDSCIASNKRL
jgi:hypothetical protein